MVYVPSKPPAVSGADGQALAAYLEDEMKSVAAGLRTSDFILFSISNKAPVKPRQGQLVYADGTHWNPGSGEGLYVYSAARSWVWLEDNPPASPPLPQGHLFGLTMSSAGSSSTLSVAAGLACDSTGVQMMSLASLKAKTTSAWAAGTAAGGLDTGTIAINTWYHWFVIENPASGAVDVLFSTSATAPTLPTGYTVFRRIGSAKTNGSSQWTKFTQNGNEFLWDIPVIDANAVAISSTISRGVTVPTGVKVNALIMFEGIFVTTARALYVGSIDVADPAGTLGTPFATVVPASGQTVEVFIDVRTDSSGSLRISANASGSSFSILTLGWRDTRGRDA